jgi:hypothetical protein
VVNSTERPSAGENTSRLAGRLAITGTAALHAGLVSALVLGLFGYWFGVADRYAIFLYEHLGATPFDAVISSRYWMAGPVAAGIVLGLATLAHFILGRLRPTYRPPRPAGVWLFCLPPLILGIPLVTMLVNAPTLPLGLALAAAGATLAGLAPALWLADGAARRPAELVWLLADGLGLLLPLLLIRALELPGRGLRVSPLVAGLVAGGSLLAGCAWLALMTAARRRWRRAMPPAGALLAAGAAWAYLLMPLAHHLFFTPAGYKYISTASNFFAFNPWLQGATWILVVGVALGISRLRRRHPSV